jgi:hypothetical protein
MRAARLALLSISLLVACGEPSVTPADDAGTDAAPIETDAGPACADFEGAYGFPLGDPCLRGTILELGTLCVTQDECALTITTSTGTMTATATGETLAFDLDGLACTVALDRGSLALSCEDASIGFSCTARGTPTRALTGACCAADDDCESTDRCAPVALGLSSSVPIASACVRRGDRARDEACVTGGSGVDDCGAGLTCSAGSLGDDMLVCRPICRAGGDCAAGEACRWYALTAPPVGYCVPGCTLFGTECPSFATCDGATALDAAGAVVDGLACRAIGTTAPGEICHRSIDCTEGHSCARLGTDYVCLPLCDDAHPCAVGTDTCRPEGSGDAPPSGVCVPA